MTIALNEQVVVITGASSGIGRETALRLGKAGACVVLASRNEKALTEAARKIEAGGGQAQIVVTDVSDWDQMQALAAEAVNNYGRIDTWINDAGVSIYGTIEETPVEEMHQLIQVNLMGVIYGCKAALPYMKQQGGGTIINVSSVVGHVAVPLQAAYSASKHGVKGFTQALRLEVEHDNSNIKVVTIFPAGINTPFFDHARSRLTTKPQPLPPVYSVELAAETILQVVENPQRDVYIGGASMAFSLLQRLSPALADRVLLLGDTGFKGQQSSQPSAYSDNLYGPLPETGRSEGDFGHMVKPSLFTNLFELRPTLPPALLLLGSLVAVVVRARSRADG